MLPALKVFDDDKIITTKDIIGEMVLHFNISEEEQKEKIPSGRWAKWVREKKGG